MADEWLAGTPATRPGVINQPPGDFQREADRLIARPLRAAERAGEPRLRGAAVPWPHLAVPRGAERAADHQHPAHGEAGPVHGAAQRPDRGQGDTTRPVVREGLHVSDGGDDIEFTLRVLPVRLAASTRVLPARAVRIEGLAGVVGRRRSRTTKGSATTPTGTRPGCGRNWRRRKQYLQSIVDEQEAASQELRAAHEEVLSSNEELQSTNEELETTKEELQSANEELTTVNEQFLSRNRELDALTDDLSNFISSADLPMVTVGRDLRIRRLTPGRAEGLQPAADRRRALARAHQVLARRRRHRRRSSTR